ncbi:MAG: hypothetical protein AAF502_06535 [Bacteroidota bacterium]
MKLEAIIDYFQSNPRKMFLLDGLGALVTAISLGVVLTKFNAFFGMPIQVLHKLALVACVFAVYSLSCHFLLSANWRKFLLLIISANATYCVASAILVGIHFQKLTTWGIAYFVIEILIIIALIYIEINALPENEKVQN